MTCPELLYLLLTFLLVLFSTRPIFKNPPEKIGNMLQPLWRCVANCMANIHCQMSMYIQGTCCWLIHHQRCTINRIKRCPPAADPKHPYIWWTRSNLALFARNSLSSTFLQQFAANATPFPVHMKIGASSSCEGVVARGLYIFTSLTRIGSCGLTEINCNIRSCGRRRQNLRTSKTKPQVRCPGHHKDHLYNQPGPSLKVEFHGLWDWFICLRVDAWASGDN